MSINTPTPKNESMGETAADVAETTLDVGMEIASEGSLEIIDDVADLAGDLLGFFD